MLQVIWSLEYEYVIALQFVGVLLLYWNKEPEINVILLSVGATQIAVGVVVGVWVGVLLAVWVGVWVAVNVVVEVLLGVTVCDAVTLGVGDGHGEP